MAIYDRSYPRASACVTLTLVLSVVLAPRGLGSAVEGLAVRDQSGLVAPPGTLLSVEMTSESGKQESCPSVCTCSARLKEVYCARRHLTAIPEGIPTSATQLYLGHNEISRVPSESFKTLTHLTKLGINNNQISDENIDPNAFAGLGNLTDLFMSQNHMETLPPTLFKNLPSLQRLYLEKNYLQQVPDLSGLTKLLKVSLDRNHINTALIPTGFLQLTSLTSVGLSNNPVGRIQTGDLAALGNSPVTKLDFSRCKLQEVDAKSFATFKALTSLVLSYNDKLGFDSVRNILDSLSGNKRLSNVGLSGSVAADEIDGRLFEGLRGLPLSTLDLSHAALGVTDNGTFSALAKLQKLFIGSSALSIIHPGTFDGLVSLETLDLSGNSLMNVPTWWAGFPVKYLDLSHNKLIEHLPSMAFANLTDLRNLSLEQCGIRVLSSDAFFGLGKLEGLDLSHNAIGGSSIGTRVFAALGHLKTLDLSFNKMSVISTEYDLFQNLISLVWLDMGNNLCYKLNPLIFQPVTQLEELYLRGNRLGDVLKAVEAKSMFSSLKSLKILDIADNALTDLNPATFDQLGKLQRLNISRNRVVGWPESLFNGTRALRELDLSRNDIASVRENAIMYMPRHVTLSLLGNPFDCYCDLIWFRNWVNRTGNGTTGHVVIPEVDRLTCNSPKSMAGKSVLEFQPRDVMSQCFPPPWQWYVVGGVSGAVIFILLVVMVTYRLRWMIRFRYHRYTLRRRRRRGRHDYEAVPGDDILYDVTVSYGPGEDAQRWVCQELIPKIDRQKQRGNAPRQLRDVNDGEEVDEGQGDQGQGCYPRWNVFFEKRDVLPNQSPIKIAEAMSCSKGVIVVVSRDYMDDNRRVSLELQGAIESIVSQRRTLREGLLLILLDPAMAVRLPVNLRRMVQDDLALEWKEDEAAQQVFWIRLHKWMEGLSPPRMEGGESLA